MAMRRQGLKRIKKRPLSERSEFRTLPVSVPGDACSPCEARTAIVGAAFFAPLFWRSKKAGRPPGRTPGLHPWQGSFRGLPACTRCTDALRRATVANVKGGFATERLLADEAMRLSCRTTRPGLGPAA